MTSRFLLVATALLFLVQSSLGQENLNPPWLFRENEKLQLSPLKERGGPFQSITGIGTGNDLAVGFAMFYLRDSKVFPLKLTIISELRGFARKGEQFLERTPMAGNCAVFLLFSEAAPSEPLIVGVSRVRPFFSVGSAHIVDEGVYQPDANGTVSASGESNELWDFFHNLAKEHGVLIPK